MRQYCHSLGVLNSLFELPIDVLPSGVFGNVVALMYYK